METKTKKNENLFVRMIVPLVVYVAFTLLVVSVYISKLDNLNSRALLDQITSATSIYSIRMQRELSYLDKAAEPMVNMMEQRIVSEEEVLEVLKDETQTCRVAILGQDGIGVDSEGNRVEVKPENFLGSIKRGMSNYYCFENGKISALTPIVRDGEMEQVLMLEYDVSEFDDLFANFNYGKEAWTILVDDKGDIIYIYNGKKSEYLTEGVNFFDMLSEAKNGNTTTIVDEISRGLVGNKEISVDGDNRRIFYKSLGINNWHMIMGVPASYIDNQLVAKRSAIKEMMIWIASGAIVFVAVVIVASLMDRVRGKVKREGLRHLAETDQLTGLYNKITTEKKIKEFIIANPDTQSLFFILDIDNFKKINDTMGHVFGDEVLRTIGQRIKMEFRASDIIGRVGGDEFIIFLKGLKEDEIIIREAQKVEKFFKDFKAGGYVKYSATASIGCAVFPRDAADFESLYKVADKALYKAKQRGKNQLAFYEEPEGFGQSV